MDDTIGAVVIGRNEGARLLNCLASLKGQAGHVVYVDSGSSDGSVEAARAAKAEVFELDQSVPFTAARARNAGFRRLLEIAPDTVFVQFLDGDCELTASWVQTARATFEREANVAIVCGRRRERFPEASRWNRMIDAEWDTPVGEARACGGDALVRRAAFESVGGYREDLIAGEEPEMCFRMRQQNWRVLRIDAEMTLHDAAMTRFSQWWQRARRAGHTYAEGFALHGASSERYNAAELRRTLVWGVFIPAAALMGAILISPWALLLLLSLPLQVFRLMWRGMPGDQAVFMVFCKFPEAQGAIGYWRGRLTGESRGLIEYK